MADIVSPEIRSRMMSRIRGKNTKPEQVIRRGLFSRGFRFRLHDPKLPGKPDLVFPKYRTVVFINGCFWHGHGCHLFRMPSTNRQFWETKIQRNRENDTRNIVVLSAAGWKVMTVWECAIRGKSDAAISELLDFVADRLKKPRSEDPIDIPDELTD